MRWDSRRARGAPPRRSSVPEVPSEGGLIRALGASQSHVSHAVRSRGTFERADRMAGAEAHREVDLGRSGDPVVAARDAPPASMAAMTRRRCPRAASVGVRWTRRSPRAGPTARPSSYDRSPRRSCVRGGRPRPAGPGSATDAAAPGARDPPRRAVAAARLTSMPMRSISSNGPIGKPAARSAASIGRPTPASPASRQPQRGDGERPVDPIDDEARACPGRRPGSCPSRSRAPSARWTTASSTVACRTTSTSGIRGTGLKKCSPRTRPGCSAAAAMSVDRQRARVGRQDDVGGGLAVERRG